MCFRAGRALCALLVGMQLLPNPPRALPGWSVHILELAEVRTRCSCKRNLKRFIMRPHTPGSHNTCITGRFGHIQVAPDEIPRQGKRGKPLGCAHTAELRLHHTFLWGGIRARSDLPLLSCSLAVGTVICKRKRKIKKKKKVNKGLTKLTA